MDAHQIDTFVMLVLSRADLITHISFPEKSRYKNLIIIIPVVVIVYMARSVEVVARL